ncbi:MAG: helix-turn-helix domain-containing protein [Chitinispirillales bacterium]|nr:helix-turn-helix domain-containing protein [Chitinispirillales bacterium]
MNEKSLGQRIIYYRKMAGMRQNELAAQIGITSSSLNYYEKDKREPNVSTLIKLAKVLNITGDRLLGIDRPESSAHDANELSLLRNCRQLNDLGIQKLLQYATDLIGNSAYKK